MEYHRLNELPEFLQPAWQKEPDLNLLAFLQKLAQESGFCSPLGELSDDILIYHPKYVKQAAMLKSLALKKIMRWTLKLRYYAHAV